LSGTPANEALYFGKSSVSGVSPSTALMTIKGNGRVGIGTTDPSVALQVGYTTSTTDTTLLVTAGDTYTATIAAYGNTQGTGMLYVGQSSIYGGGIVYNGDDNPNIVNTPDTVSFFRRNNGTDTEVFSYAYDISTVYFRNKIDVSGTSQSVAIIRYSGGFAFEDWPSSWGGGLSTYDICCASIKYSGLTSRSDDRLKMNEEYITNATDTLNKLKPQIYDKLSEIGNTSNYVREAGLIAQEVYVHAPELRYLINVPDEFKDKLDSYVNIYNEDPTIDPDYSDWSTSNTMSIDYQSLTAYLIKAVQEKDTEINELNNKLLQLENRIIALENH
jgi:hypothetical protein